MNAYDYVLWNKLNSIFATLKTYNFNQVIS